MMTADEVQEHFTHPDGRYGFARWGRPIAAVAFGVEDETRGLLRSAIEAVCIACGHSTSETDAELGSNMMVFFMRDWSELRGVKDLDKLIPDLLPLVDRLEQQDANQYRVFRFDAENAIKACFVFLRMDDELETLGADTLILGQVIQSMLLWGQGAFATKSPLALAPEGQTIVRPEIAALLRAAYDPMMPNVADDASHSLRLSARLGLAQ